MKLINQKNYRCALDGFLLPAVNRRVVGSSPLPEEPILFKHLARNLRLHKSSLWAPQDPGLPAKIQVLYLTAIGYNPFQYTPWRDLKTRV